MARPQHLSAAQARRVALAAQGFGLMAAWLGLGAIVVASPLRGDLAGALAAEVIRAT